MFISTSSLESSKPRRIGKLRTIGFGMSQNGMTCFGLKLKVEASPQKKETLFSDMSNLANKPIIQTQKIDSILRNKLASQTDCL